MNIFPCSKFLEDHFITCIIYYKDVSLLNPPLFLSVISKVMMNTCIDTKTSFHTMGYFVGCTCKRMVILQLCSCKKTLQAWVPIYLLGPCCKAWPHLSGTCLFSWLIRQTKTESSLLLLFAFFYYQLYISCTTCISSLVSRGNVPFA